MKFNPAKALPKNKIVMMPSTHDLFPEHLDYLIKLIQRLDERGNRIVLATKPRADTILPLADRLASIKDVLGTPLASKILWRLTIGSSFNESLAFWEPGAPLFEERFLVLKTLFNAGLNISVSMEPYLDLTVVNTFHQLQPFVRETIWVGKLNKLDQRVNLAAIPADKMHFIDEVRRVSTDEWMMSIYKNLRSEPKIMWKDSFLKFFAQAGIAIEKQPQALPEE